MPLVYETQIKFMIHFCSPSPSIHRNVANVFFTWRKYTLRNKVVRLNLMVKKIQIFKIFQAIVRHMSQNELNLNDIFFYSLQEESEVRNSYCSVTQKSTCLQIQDLKYAGRALETHISFTLKGRKHRTLSSCPF